MNAKEALELTNKARKECYTLASMLEYIQDYISSAASDGDMGITFNISKYDKGDVLTAAHKLREDGFYVEDDSGFTRFLEISWKQ